MSFLTHCLKYWPSWPLRNGFPAPGQDPWDRKAIVGPGLCPIKSISSTLVTVACPEALYKEQWLDSMKLILFGLIELLLPERMPSVPPGKYLHGWKGEQVSPSGQGNSQSSRAWDLGSLILPCVNASWHNSRIKQKFKKSPLTHYKSQPRWP